MSRVRVHGFTLSLDGYSASEDQSFDYPFGEAGDRIRAWMESTFRFGQEPEYGVLHDVMSRANYGVGATILGRNMFGPQRGPWASDEKWKGWWGDNPPYHHPTFVMTHHPRESIPMEGGTTFHFVEGTPQAVLALAKDAAGDQDVCVRGGVQVMRGFLRAGLVDEAHIIVAPLVIGSGERLWDGLENLNQFYDVREAVGIENHTHLRLMRKTA